MSRVGGLVLLAGAPLRLALGVGGVAPTGRPPLTATVGMVHRVHHHTAHGRTLPPPARAPRLAVVHDVVLGVADRPDRGPAGDVHLADLAGGQPERGPVAFLREQLDAVSGAATELRTAAGAHLHRVHDGTDGDVAQRQRVAHADVSALTGLEHVADLQALGGQDVALLTVDVVQQGDAGGAVRVVLDGRDLRRHAVLRPPEVDPAVPALVPAALVARGDATVHVAAGLLGVRTRERLVRAVGRDGREVRHAHATAAGCRRFVLADPHGEAPSSRKATSGRVVRPRSRRCRWCRLRRA